MPASGRTRQDAVSIATISTSSTSTSTSASAPRCHVKKTHDQEALTTSCTTKSVSATVRRLDRGSRQTIQAAIAMSK